MAGGWREQVDRIVKAAIAAGTHTEATFVTVCAGCREWRPAYHKTEDGRHLCRACTPPGELAKERVAHANP